MSALAVPGDPVGHVPAVPLEPLVVYGVQWLKLGVEIVGASVVAIGVIVAAVIFFRTPFSGGRNDFQRVRLTLAHYLLVGLEFQLAADILSTAIAPTWDHIGKLSAVAVIRTVLNVVLKREMQHETRTTGDPPL